MVISISVCQLLVLRMGNCIRVEVGSPICHTEDGSNSLIQRSAFIMTNIHLGLSQRTMTTVGSKRSPLLGMLPIAVQNPSELVLIDHRPFADERHCDNMGFEVLRDFPSVHKRF